MRGIMRVCLLFGGVLSSFLCSFQAVSGQKPEINCLPNHMEISVPKSPDLSSIKAEELTLNSDDCLAEERNEKFYFKTAFDQCGTTIGVTNSTIVYSNNVRSRSPPKDVIIDRIRKVEIAFSCTYPRKEKLTSSNLQPSNTLPIKQEYTSQGKFIFSLQLFPTDQFKDPYRNYPVTVKLRQLIYIQVAVQSVRKQLSILAQKCYATPTRDGDEPKHELIEDSCHYPDTTLKIIKSSAKNIQRFSVEAFYFTKSQSDYIYLHCHVIACDGSDDSSVCARGCSNKRSEIYKRDRKEVMTFKLTQGPILVRKELDASKRESRLHKNQDDAINLSFLHDF